MNEERGLASRPDLWLFFPLATTAILFAAASQDFGFDPAGFLDSFMYFGYFWHYPEHLPVFDDYYKISRLPWILPGYVAHALGGAIAGSYVLGYASLTLGTVALYLLVRDALRDRTAAAVTAVAFAGCTQVHGVGGWAYHVVPAGSYYLMACWLTVRAAAGPRPRTAAAMAGAFGAAAVHTHLFLAVFVPLLLPLYFAAGTGSRRWNIVLRDLCLMAGGAIALTGGLGAINAATGGEGMFFMPQIEHALRLSAPGNDVWWLGDPAGWLPGALHLVLPAAFLAAGIHAVFRGEGGISGRVAKVFVAQAWVALAIMAYFQFVRRQTMLDYPYMAFVLYLHAFPCLAAALVRAVPERRADRASIAFSAMALILGVLLLAGRSTTSAWVAAPPALAGALGNPSAGIAALFGISCVIVTAFCPRRLQTVAFAAWFAVLNAWIAPNPSSYGADAGEHRQQMLAMFREADRFTSTLDPTLRGIKYWIPSASDDRSTGPMNLTPVFSSYVATRTWLPNLLGRSSPGPRIDEIRADAFGSGPCIGVLSAVESQPDLQRRMQQHFERLGMPLEAVASRRFGTPDLAFALTVLRKAGTTRVVHDAVPPCLPLRSSPS